MRLTIPCLLGALALMVALAPAALADSFTVGGTTYADGSTTETVSGGFVGANAPAAQEVSSNTYSNLVRVVVSGVGQSQGTNYNDAFYVYEDAAGNPIGPNHGLHYQLAFSTSGITGASGSPTPSSMYITEYIVYDIDAGSEVTPDYLPTYRSDHTYEFLIDIGTTNATLYFAVANGIYTDNSGAYSITMTQMNPVPEPASLALFGLGALGFAAHRRRRRS